jgi:hypothetical protein
MNLLLFHFADLADASKPITSVRNFDLHVFFLLYVSRVVTTIAPRTKNMQETHDHRSLMINEGPA